MRQHPALRLAVGAVLLATSVASGQVAGTRIPDVHVWEPIEFVVPTAATAAGGLRESSRSPDNPWLDYRLQAWFVSPSLRIQGVPGFYAADGEGGDGGAVWKVRFTPDEPGLWGIVYQFEKGPRLNVRDMSVRGARIAPNGKVDFFRVAPVAPSTTGFYAYGPLEAVGGSYLRFRNGRWFVKGGVNSPENFLAYEGFDHPRDMGNLPDPGVRFIHRYATHAQDWQPGDPNWTSGGDPNAGKAIIGALNYLSSVGINSIYFLPMNLGGDGQDTFPFLDPTGTAFDQVVNYDVGRLEQWDTVMEHAQRKGILLEVVLAEQENENITWLGRGLTDQRRLYLKTLIAMYGHHLALRWILCEENAPEPNDEFSVQELSDIADFIRAWSFFDHPIAVHTIPNDQAIFQQILTQSRDPSWLTSASLQVHRDYAEATRRARGLFDTFNRPAVVDVDEIGTDITGLTPGNQDYMRRFVLWDVMMSGGNMAWYMGYHPLAQGGGDIRLEDFRTRESMWQWTTNCRRLLEQVPFWRMEPDDSLSVGATTTSTYGGAEVFADPGLVYLVYLPSANDTGSLDLRAAPSGARFHGAWYDPRTGDWAGTPVTLQGGGIRDLPDAPNPAWNDWTFVALRR